MRENPYASPQAELQSAPVQVLQRLASRKQRVFNFLLDLMFCYVIFKMIVFVLFIFSPGIMNIWQIKYFGYIVTLFAYYFIQESVWHSTIAKSVTGTRVVTTTGHEPGVLQIFLRTLTRFIPFEFVSFLRLTPVSQGNAVEAAKSTGAAGGWHDKLSKTCVIDIRTV